MKELKDNFLIVRIESSIKQKLKDLAQEQGVTLSKLIVKNLTNELTV